MGSPTPFHPLYFNENVDFQRNVALANESGVERLVSLGEVNNSGYVFPKGEARPLLLHSSQDISDGFASTVRTPRMIVNHLTLQDPCLSEESFPIPNNNSMGNDILQKWLSIGPSTHLVACYQVPCRIRSSKKFSPLPRKELLPFGERRAMASPVATLSSLKLASRGVK